MATDILTAQVRTWERMEGETDKAWAAFQIFIDLPPHERTMREAWRRSHPEGSPKRQAQPPGSWKTWTKRYEWSRRADDYDDYLQAQARRTAEELHIERIRDYQDRLVQFGSVTSSASIRLMQKLLPKITNLKSKDINAKNLPSLVKASIDLMNAATAMQAQALGIDELLEALDEQNKLFQD